MLETCVGIWTDRHFPISALAEQCRALESSGAVDGVLIPDQLSGFVPKQLWKPENTPFAALLGDPDSAMDAFMVAPYVHAAAPALNIHLTTDSVRRAPAELVQSMLTLAHITEGRANFQIGGGETKQTAPFGHPSNQGMSRMKDLFQIYRRFMEAEEPISFEGRRWQLDRAFLGGAKQHRATLWGLGGGPQLLDYATSWADGLAVAVPNVLTSPERAAESVAAIRRQVEEKGRDPDAFRIGLWASVLLHPDAAKLDAALENPIIKFVSAALGRIDTSLWDQEGLSLPFPEGWTYFKHLLPYAMDDRLIENVVGATTREHIRRAWLIGSPQDVAAQIKPYLDVGIDWVIPFDYLPVVGNPADAAASAGWMIELCTAMKQMASVPA
jgi:phthiodiolone/phenolphthiodiolone dimycocerosates ketoreductase